jgi:hypothetical protein
MSFTLQKPRMGIQQTMDIEEIIPETEDVDASF